MWGEDADQDDAALAEAKDLLARAMSGKGDTLQKLARCARLALSRSGRKASNLHRTCINAIGQHHLHAGNTHRAIRCFRRATEVESEASTHPKLDPGDPAPPARRAPGSRALLTPVRPGFGVASCNLGLAARKVLFFRDWDDTCAQLRAAALGAARRARTLMTPYLLETFGFAGEELLVLASRVSNDLHLLAHRARLDDVPPPAAPRARPARRAPARARAPPGVTRLGGRQGERLRAMAPLRVGGLHAGPRGGGGLAVRVGLLSLTGFDSHSLSPGRFLRSVLRLVAAAAAVELRCYGGGPAGARDPVARDLAAVCPWADTRGLGAGALATRLRADELHVAIDLSGFSHQPSFRLTPGVGARSPQPQPQPPRAG